MNEPIKKWQIAVSILLFFALGTAAGTYGSRIIFKKRVSKVLHSEGTPGIQVIQGMVRRLDLSEAQRTAIDAIVDANNEKWDTIRQEYEPKIQALFETVIEETKKELTPRQREEVEKMSANVQRRLPPRNSSRPRSSGPLEGSVPPEGSTLPDTSGPPRSRSQSDTSGPPAMGQPYVPKADSDRVAAIIEELQVDPEKSASIQAIIEADLLTQETMREDFQKSQEAAEEKFRKELSDAQLAIEKKLEGLLTSEQIETYRQLIRREEQPPDDFMFDGHGNGREPKNFRQEELPAPAGEESDKTKVLRTL